MLHIDVENAHAWKVDASLVLADVDKAESSDRIIAGNTDGHASAEHGPNAKEGQSRSQSSRALEDATMESHRGISTLEDAPMAVEATKVNGQNGSTAGNGNSNGNGTHTAGPTGAQATAPSAAPAAAHGTPDLEALKADILKCMAEAVEESKAPDSTLHKPVPFKAIHRLLQGRNLDVDDKKLQKLFDECDADRDQKVSLVEFMEFLREEPSIPTPDVAASASINPFAWLMPQHGATWLGAQDHNTRQGERVDPLVNV